MIAVRLILAMTLAVFCIAQTGSLARADDNGNTLSIISSDFSGPLRWMADDLAETLNDGDNLRVVPVFGIGRNETVPDAAFLTAMDIAFVHSDLLAYAKRHELDRTLENQLRYIAKLYAKDIGIIAAKSIGNIRELAGKKVNFDDSTSSNYSTSVLIFELLQIDVERVQLSQALAIEKIKSGEIAATVVVDDKPNQMIATLRSEQGLRLVPIEYSDELQKVYVPSSFTSDDYPELIASGQSVDSVAVNVVMALRNRSPNSSRHARVSRFVAAFFAKFDLLRQASRHPNWQKVNIAAPLPGWTRFEPAEELLGKKGTPATWEGAMSNLRVEFQEFVEAQSASPGGALTDAQERSLFKQFLGWKENTTKAMIRMHMTATRGVGGPIGTITARNVEIEIAGVAESALLLEPALTGLPPGPHAFHIHANPNCGPGQKNGILVAGLGAGDDVGLTAAQKNRGGHLGDLSDLVVAADGTARQAIIVPRLNMADLLDRSILIHADVSDTSSRLACGVVN